MSKVVEHVPQPASPPDSAARPQEPVRPGSIEELVGLELPAEKENLRDGGKEWLARPPRDLFGIALSGGGIRSATFNLGLLQGLHELKLLRCFDYLSTVSGGGYLGSFWTAWRHRRAPSPPSSGAAAASRDAPPEARGWLARLRPAWLARLLGRKARAPDDAAPDPQPSGEGPSPDVFPPLDPASPDPEPAEIRHLREFSNFLVPRLGLFSFDTGRLIVAAVSAMIPSLLAAFALLGLALFAWAGAVWLLFAPDRGTLASVTLPGANTLIVAITGIALVAFESAWRRRKEVGNTLAYAVAAALAAALTLWIWTRWIDARLPADAMARGQLLPVLRDDQPPRDWLYLLAPCAAWAGAGLVFVAVRLAFSRAMDTYEGRVIRAAFDRAQSRLFLLAAAWAAVALLWCTGVWLEHRVFARDPVPSTTGLAGLTAVLAAAFARVQHLVSKEKRPSVSPGRMARLKPHLPRILAYLVLALMVVATAALIAAAYGGRLPGGGAGTVLAAAAALTLATLLLFNPNEVGLHSFYRSRLVRAYLGASNLAGKRKVEELPDDDIRLDQLRPGADPPFHLVCCAANDIASRDTMANLHRGAESAVLSRVGCSVGGRWARWKDYGASPTLGAAITASGAAFNPLMGSKSVELGPAVTFLMAALNLRLGIWVGHPAPVTREARLGRDRRGAGSLRRAIAEAVMGWPAGLARRYVANRLRRHWNLPELGIDWGSIWGGKRVFVGLAFYRELFGLASSTGRDVHLSDGGHFENMAVYELIRRHCRVILASDCGMDPQTAFDDFGNLVRRVREDFGVDIRIDLSPLRPDGDGLSRQPMVAGDIHYPDGDTGVLLLFKPTLVGNEPADVAQYRRRNAAFPHESTGDQFYTEAQWESYRRLGQHAAHSAFRTVLTGLDLEPRTGVVRHADVMEAFARARREWLPEPEGFDERLSHYAERVAELDELLRQPGCEALLGQVYKEIDELDRRKVWLPGIVLHPEPTNSTGTEGPEPKELAVSLYLIRRALLLMEEIYQREDLEHSHGHPLYLGVMNWFARWAYAPRFRMWWPLLKALYPQPFTRFVESHFALPTVERKGGPDGEVVTGVQSGGDGFAALAWKQQGSRPPGPGEEVVSYNLHMLYRGEVKYSVQAAQVIATRLGGALVWDAPDFFVPPGLWGVGIGGDFLKKMSEAAFPPVPRPGDGGPGAAVTHLVARVTSDPRQGTAEKQRVATELQLYRASGFREAYLREGVLRLGETEVATPPAEWLPADGRQAQWLVLPVGAPEPAWERAEARAGAGD